MAPPVAADEAERVAAFQRLFARADEQTLYVSHGGVRSQSTNYLILGDGTRVYHPEDLLPVVPADSPTAHYAALARKHVDDAHPWFIATIVTFAATFVLPATSPLLFDKTSDAVKFSLITGAAGIAASAVLLLKTRSVVGDGGDRLSAFTTYNDDLRKRLDVCVDGTRVVGCAAQPAPAPAPPSTP